MSVVRFRPEAPFFHGAIGRHEKIMLPEGESKGGSWKQSGGLFQPPWLFRRKAIPPGGCHIEGMQPSAPPLPPRHCLSSDSARRPSRRRDAIFCIVPLFAALFPLRSRSARNLIFAAVAHLVERHLAKVEVASSSLVSRSKKKTPVRDRCFLFGIRGNLTTFGRQSRPKADAATRPRLAPARRRFAVTYAAAVGRSLTKSVLDGRIWCLWTGCNPGWPAARYPLVKRRKMRPLKRPVG